MRNGNYLLAGAFLPGDKVNLRYAVKFVNSEGPPVLTVEVINTGTCPLYIKQVLLGWRFDDEKSDRFLVTLLNTKEDSKTALPPGLDREYQGSIAPLILSHGTELRRYDDVWISVETPKGEIQKVVGLAGMFSAQLLSMLPFFSESHVVGEYLYPT